MCIGFFLIDLLRVYIAFALCVGVVGCRYVYNTLLYVLLFLSVKLLAVCHVHNFCCICIYSLCCVCLFELMAVLQVYIVFYAFVCYDSWLLGYLFWGSLTVRIVGCLLWLPMVLLVLCCVWLLADDSMLCFLFGYWFLAVFVCKADHCSSIFGCLIILCRTPLMTFSSQKTFKLLDLKIFWLWPYLLNVIPEKCQPH